MADAYDELRQTLITRIEGMIHDVQREIHANNVEHETLDGLCFRGEQLARQVARLVTANVLDSSVLNCIMFAYEPQHLAQHETCLLPLFLKIVLCYLSFSVTSFSATCRASYSPRKHSPSNVSCSTLFA